MTRLENVATAILASGLLLGSLVLSGCAARLTPDPIVRVVEVPKPVQQPCLARVAAKPRYADQDAASQYDIYEQVRALLTGIAQRGAREQKLENAVVSCGGAVE